MDKPQLGEMRDGKFFDGEMWRSIYIEGSLDDYRNTIKNQAEYIQELLERLRKARKQKKRWKRKALEYKKLCKQSSAQ